MNASEPDSELRFDGRVAVITGAGGQAPSLGRAYAWLFASRGARVVVNDLGVGPDGRGGLAANAEMVAKEIIAAGGEAIPNTSSVAGSESAREVVKSAIDTWGRIDALVNNAGILALALFDEVSDTDCELVVSSHLMGAIWMCRAAWPHMRRQGYGRIVNVSSASMFGTPYNAIYGAAKAGMYGLTRGLALEGKRYGIGVNALHPQAATLKHRYLLDDNADFHREETARTVEQVAPVVAYLCHERCTMSGQLVYAGGGLVSEYFFLRTRGFRKPDLMLEDVRDNLDRIVDRDAATEVPDLDASWYERVKAKPYKPVGS
jgi:NAD(P)-dependent dehydrogenase (short-subunit alcohol dehydrogenase family)